MTKSNQPHHGELWEKIRDRCPNAIFQLRPDLWQLRFPVNNRLPDGLEGALMDALEHTPERP